LPLVAPAGLQKRSILDGAAADESFAWPRASKFLRAIDYDFPAWAEEYMSAMETALGETYSEPAADVRGDIG